VGWGQLIILKSLLIGTICYAGWKKSSEKTRCQRRDLKNRFQHRQNRISNGGAENSRNFDELKAESKRFKNDVVGDFGKNK
jgi:hypothetical protein